MYNYNFKNVPPTIFKNDAGSLKLNGEVLPICNI